MSNMMKQNLRPSPCDPAPEPVLEATLRKMKEKLAAVRPTDRE